MSFSRVVFLSIFVMFSYVWLQSDDGIRDTRVVQKWLAVKDRNSDGKGKNVDGGGRLIKKKKTKRTYTKEQEEV